MDIQVNSKSTIFPETLQVESKKVALSIIDSSVANYSCCGAIWFYNPPTSPDFILSETHLKTSLAKTLNNYPQWCGQLVWSSPSKPGHTNRYRRIWISYGTPKDLGITFVTATSPKNLSDFLPSASVRSESMKAWDASQLPSSQLLPETKLAASGVPNAPNVIIQHTTFSCGSTALAIEITHCLSDATALGQFAKDWSSISRAMMKGTPLPKLKPIFDPQLLDLHAAGDIDASTPDPSIIAKSRALPMHRYDWYLPSPSQPSPPNVPSDFDKTWELSPSEPIPWHQWDLHAPVSHRILHFSATEIRNIHTLAVSTGAQISTHDALAAHIWSRINTARNLPLGTRTFLNLSFGLRTRVSPPLPNEFIGSPVLMTAIPSVISEPGPSVAELAKGIRETLGKFTSEAIANLLHDEAFEVSPQRLWRGCLGREHILLTSWIHSGVYEVDFSREGTGGGRPVFVEAIMPSCDGLVEVGEGSGRAGCKEGGKWWEDGADVNVFIEKGAMERLLGDRTLFVGV